MDIDSIRVAVAILADLRDTPKSYTDMMHYATKLYGLPPETLDQLVRCHLADTCPD